MIEEILFRTLPCQTSYGKEGKRGGSWCHVKQQRPGHIHVAPDHHLKLWSMEGRHLQFCPDHLSSYPRSAITKYHTLGTLKLCKLTTWQIWRLSAQINVPAGSIPSIGFQWHFFMPASPQLLVRDGNPWHSLAYENTPPISASVFTWLSSYDSLSPPLIKRGVILEQGPPTPA